MVDLDDLSVYGYELERLLKIKHQCDEICAWFLNEKGSIRMCAKNVCMSKSLVHKYIHTYIKKYYDEEYQQILDIERNLIDSGLVDLFSKGALV